MYYFIFPALIAFIFKAYILIVSRKSDHKVAFFIPMLIVFALHNLCELSAYIQFFDGSLSLSLFKTYYSITFVMFGFMAIYALKVSQLFKSNMVINVIYVLCVIFSFFAFTTDSIVVGIQSIGYSSMAVKGDFYWVFQLYILVMLLFVPISLFIRYKQSELSETKIACSVAFFAFLPILTVSLLVLALMFAGVNLNASGLMPIATTLFLFILVKYEANEGITDIRRWIPYSRQKRLTNELMSLSSLYSTDKIGYKEMLVEFEKLSIEYKYHESGGNISEAARRMKLKRTTLYSMIDRTGIKERLLDKH